MKKKSLSQLAFCLTANASFQQSEKVPDDAIPQNFFDSSLRDRGKAELRQYFQNNFQLEK